MKKIYLKKLTFLLFSVALLASFITMSFSNISFGVADAVFPKSYKDYISDSNKNRDWFMDEEYLNIDNVLKIVESWKTNSNFDLLALEADPVVVAVIDTGVNVFHDMFMGDYDKYGRPVTNSEVGDYDVIYRNTSGDVIGYNAHDKDNDFSDDDLVGTSIYHGTHVAGIVATLIHSLNLEKYIKIMPIRASYRNGSNDSFLSEDVDDALRFAYENGADVVNMSFGSNKSVFSKIVKEYVDKMVLVASAGNQGRISGFHSTFYPAASPGVIGVMNYRENAEFSSKIYLDDTSNYGQVYDVVAPGNNIYSSNGGYVTAYSEKTGTSMSAPMVSFASALLLGMFRAQNHNTDYYPTPSDVKNIVRNHSTKTAIKASNMTEYPILDISALLENDYFISDNDVTINPPEQDKTIKTLSIMTDSNLFQTKGKVEDVAFEVISDGDLSDYNVTWYIESDERTHKKIGEGTSFIFNTPNEVKSYSIYAKVDGLVDVSSSAIVEVSYSKIDKDNISFYSNRIINLYGTNYLYKNESIVIGIENHENIDKNNEVTWLINGEEHSSFYVLNFSSDIEDNYKIEMMLNNSIVPISFNINVSDEDVAAVCSTNLHPALIYVFIGILIILLIFVIIRYAKFLKKKKCKIQANDIENICKNQSELEVDVLNNEENLTDSYANVLTINSDEHNNKSENDIILKEIASKEDKASKNDKA